MFPRSYPKGQSVEIIKTSKLRYFLNKFNKEQKEHVTKYFYKNYKNFMIKNFISVKKNTKIKLAIDTKNDLKLILKKFNKEKFINFSLNNENYSCNYRNGYRSKAFRCNRQL